MLNSLFPSHWSTLKKLIWLKAAQGGSGGLTTLTGSIVSFIASKAKAINKIEVEIDSQSGATGANIYNDPKYGGFIQWNQLVKNGNFASTSDWGASTYGSLSANNGKLVLTITATSNRAWNVSQALATTAGHKYLYSGYLQRDMVSADSGSASTGYNFRLGDKTFHTYTLNNVGDVAHIFEVVESDGRTNINIQKSTCKPTTNAIFTIWNIMLLDLTVMFGQGNEPTADEFKALFPDDYYAYNAGTQTNVSAVTNDNYTKVSISWSSQPGSITSGKLTISEDGSVSLASGGNTYNLTSVTPIDNLLGYNNIWADVGDIAVTIPSNIITNSVDALPVANQGKADMMKLQS